MPTSPLIYNALPKTISPEEFESMCKDFLSDKYKDVDGFEIFGGRGHEQGGIDIISNDVDYNKKYIIAQSKNYLKEGSENRLITKINKDVTSAKQMIKDNGIAVSRFIAMTSMDSNPKVKLAIAKINADTSEFSVQIIFWNEISNRIWNNTELRRRYYSLFLKDEDEVDEIHYTDDPKFMESWKAPLQLFDEIIMRKDAYVHPDYVDIFNKKGDRKSGIQLEERLITNIVSNNNNVHIIYGYPGSGKSSLLLRLWHHPKLVDNRIVYFSCRNMCEWFNTRKPEKIWASLYTRMKQAYLSLGEDTTLLLDGLDELNLSSEIEEGLLRCIEEDVSSNRRLKNVIISCRNSDITDKKIPGISAVQLQSFSIKQMVEYANKCGEKNYQVDIEPELEDVYGIPLVLYMIIASKLNIGEYKTVHAVYNQLFNPNGGIFTRSINKIIIDQDVNTDGSILHYGNSHTLLKKIAGDIHKVNQKIAYYIFENDPDKLTCDSEYIETLIDDIDSDMDFKDLLRGSFYNIHILESNGVSKVSYIHKTMYEHFVVEYVKNVLFSLFRKNEIEFREASKMLGEIFKKGKLNKQMRDSLEQEISNKFSNCSNQEKKAIFNYWESMMLYLLRSGFTINAGSLFSFHDILRMEQNSFLHLLELTQILHKALKIEKKIFETNPEIINYLPDYICQKHEKLDFSEFAMDSVRMTKANLSRCNLSKSSMKNAHMRNSHFHNAKFLYANMSSGDFSLSDFRGADLTGAIMTNTDLQEATFKEAQLKDVTLNDANITNACLANANLSNANFTNANLSYADLRGGNYSQHNF